MKSLMHDGANLSELLLQLRNLCCERDGRALFASLSAEIAAGSVVQVIGPNGSGKTTLLRILAGINRDFSGDILWRGQSMAKNRLDYLNHLLYLGHQVGVKRALSPRENLAWWAGMNRGHKQIAIDDALAEVGLGGFEDTPCYNLSAGQQRRVALARLHLTPALLWILDEPFTAIDKTGVARLEQLIAEHAAGGGSVLLTTHQDVALDRVKTLNLADFEPAPQQWQAEEWGFDE